MTLSQIYQNVRQTQKKIAKKITEKRRELLAEEIKEKALAWSISRVDVDIIDEINILQASLRAMALSVAELSQQPDFVMIDGNKIPKDLTISAEAVVKGDDRVPCISAASIIAKVARDWEMIEMEEVYPGYGLARHKGYPTKLHIEALQQLGVTEIHRRSFLRCRPAGLIIRNAKQRVSGSSSRRSSTTRSVSSAGSVSSSC